MTSAALAATLAIECRVCHTVGTVETASPEADCEAWAATSCFFVPGCLGHVWPDSPN